MKVVRKMEDGARRPGHGLERDAPATREEFKSRVEAWARKLEVEAHAIYIRPMRRKWASCSSAGTLTFNAELLGMPKDLGDYVIVHELLHLAVPNHGKLWKSLMRVHLGQWETLEQRMKGLD